MYGPVPPGENFASRSSATKPETNCLRTFALGRFICRLQRSTTANVAFLEGSAAGRSRLVHCTPRGPQRGILRCHITHTPSSVRTSSIDRCRKPIARLSRQIPVRPPKHPAAGMAVSGVGERPCTPATPKATGALPGVLVAKPFPVTEVLEMCRCVCHCDDGAGCLGVILLLILMGLFRGC